MTAPIEEKLCRDEFDEWYVKPIGPDWIYRNKDGVYESVPIKMRCWQAWQAAWSQRVPDGMVVVPVEPTLEMLADFHNKAWPELSSSNREGPMREAYAAMIAPLVNGDE